MWKENRILLFVNFCILCFFSIYELKDDHHTGIGIFDFVIMIFTNHYYVLYFMLPTVFVVIGKKLKNIRTVEIIRYKNAYQYTYSTMLRFVKWIFLYLLFHIISLVVIGTAVLKNSTNPIPVSEERIALLNRYSSYFHSSILSTTVIVMYLIFGFTVLMALLSYINNRYGYKKTILTSVILYLLTFIGFKTEIKTLIPMICFNNYILLHHGLFVNGGVKFLALLLTGITIIGFSLGKIKKGNAINIDELILSRKERIFSLLFPIALLLIETLRNTVEMDFRWRNVIATTFLGVGEQSSSFVSWLRLTLLYMLPLFFIGVSDRRIQTYCQASVVLRYGNRHNFEYKITREYLKYICSYTVVLILIGNLFHSLEPVSAQGKDLLSAGFGVEFTSRIWNIYFFIFFVNLLFDYIVFKSICKHTGSLSATILLLVFKFILYLLPGINPLSLNFGVLNLYENMGYKQDLLYKVSVLFAGIVGYFGTIAIRRCKYVNHRSEKYQ